MLSHVLEVTRVQQLLCVTRVSVQVTRVQQLQYVGHSMGTLAYFTACNYHPWVCQRCPSPSLL